jgi:3-dehydroquinate synthase
VEADEREETGARALLNYGHTFAHALEAITGYRQLLHGEAVSLGMVCAARLAESLGRVDPSVGRVQRQLLTALGLPVELPAIDGRHLLELMRHDKKADHGLLRFVLPSRLGHSEIVDGVEDENVLAALGD